MPTYDYVCERGHRTEYRQPIDDEALTECPKYDCDAPAKREISLGAGFVVKGGPAPEPEGPACGPSCCQLPH